MRPGHGPLWLSSWALVKVTAIAMAMAAVSGCSETPASNPDAAGPDAAGIDARVPDAGRDAGPDAAPDASVDASGILHDFCDEPFFKLPIDGYTERTSSIAIDRHRVAWSKKEMPATVFGEVYLLDLETCVERQLTQGSRAGWLHLSGQHLVFDDFKDLGGPWCTDLYHLDLSTGIIDRLTQTTGCELEPKTNGRYVVFRWLDNIVGPPTLPPTLRLLDMQTGQDIELWPSAVDSFDIDERYVVWPGYGQDPLSVGRDVYFHDLQTGETHHLDFTYERYQWWVFIWNGWVTIQGTDAGLWDPINYLQLYHLETQELRLLVEDDHSSASAPIDSGLAVWNTSAYSQEPRLLPADMEIYDIGAGFSRRLTTHAGQTAPMSLASPYLLIVRLLNLSSSYMNDFYVANLDALGVIDATGNLIPGDPVIDPP